MRKLLLTISSLTLLTTGAAFASDTAYSHFELVNKSSHTMVSTGSKAYGMTGWDVFSTLGAQKGIMTSLLSYTYPASSDPHFYSDDADPSMTFFISCSKTQQPEIVTVSINATHDLDNDKPVNPHATVTVETNTLKTGPLCVRVEGPKQASWNWASDKPGTAIKQTLYFVDNTQ